MKRSVPIAALLLALSGGAPAWAGAYGNPVSRVEHKELGVGLAFASNRQTLFAEYGLTERDNLQFMAGFVTVEKADGKEIGVRHRYRFEEGFAVGDEQARIGLLGIFRLGQLEAGGSHVSFNQLDVGFGTAITTLKNVDPYLIAVYRRFSAESGVRGKGHSNTESDAGLVIGAEFRPRTDILLGAELHAGLEDEDFALYGEKKF